MDIAGLETLRLGHFTAQLTSSTRIVNFFEGIPDQSDFRMADESCLPIYVVLDCFPYLFDHQIEWLRCPCCRCFISTASHVSVLVHAIIVEKLHRSSHVETVERSWSSVANGGGLDWVARPL
jgi:hypothetical protein